MITLKQHFNIMLKVNKITECATVLAIKTSETALSNLDNATQDLVNYLQDEIGIKESSALDRGLITKYEYYNEIEKALEDLL